MEVADKPLLLDLARDAFRTQIAKRVRPLARSYVERWKECEFWLYRSVVQKHGVELRAYKSVVTEVLRNTPLDEVLEICRTTRPDLDDLWKTPEARAKLGKEIERAIGAVAEL